MPFSRFELSTFALVFIALLAAGCLQGLGLQRGTTPDGRPSVELCAEIARAQPSASGPSVAAAPTPSASASAGTLRHAQ